MLTRKYWMPPVAVICTALFVQALPCSGKTVFMIGNSFTHNSEPYSLPAIAARKSDALTVGAHIKSGSPVHNIWGSPDAGREISKEFGKYRDALTKHPWDVVTLPPFYKRPGGGFPQSTMQSDIDSILKFIELAPSPGSGLGHHIASVTVYATLFGKTRSLGVLSDVKKGGLKKDLTIAFEKDEVFHAVFCVGKDFPSKYIIMDEARFTSRPSHQKQIP